MCGLAPVLAADTREPRLCAALRADAVPSAGHDFVMQPHEDPLLAVGFLAVEPRGQLEARQAIVLGFAGECRRSRIVLGSLVSAVEDGGLQVRDGSADIRLLEQLVSLPPRPRAVAELSFPSRPSRVAVVRPGEQFNPLFTNAFLTIARVVPLRVGTLCTPRVMRKKKGLSGFRNGIYTDRESSVSH